MSDEDVTFERTRDRGGHNRFSHTGSYGLAPGDQVANVGYDWAAVGENTFAVQTIDCECVGDMIRLPGALTQYHVFPYSEFGAGSYTLSGSDNPTYWIQEFLKR